MADSKLLDVRDLSKLTHPGSFVLEEFDLSAGDFDGLPDRPSDCRKFECSVFEEVKSQRFSDTEGDHSFSLDRLKISVVKMLASLADEQVEVFARRWSSDDLFLPFQLPKGITLEEAERRCREDAFRTLYAFLQHFIPFCRQALSQHKDVYVLWEHVFLAE